MAIILAVASIVVITVATSAVRKLLPFRVCPICTGVAGTWLWMLIAVLTHQLPIADYLIIVSPDAAKLDKNQLNVELEKIYGNHF